MTVGHEVLIGDAKAVEGQLGDTAQCGALSNIDVAEWQGGLRKV
jgi:hypothetical protein